MTWSKLSDDFPDDCDCLSDAAFRLHVEGLCWSNRKLLDCRIPRDHLRRFATHPEALPELVAVGWWTEDGDELAIRHHAGYQRTREQVLAQQAANAANGKKGGRPRKGTGSPRELSEIHPLTRSASESRSERDGTGSGQEALTGPLAEDAHAREDDERAAALRAVRARIAERERQRQATP
ncbi:hypothetical protein JD79_04113 [Geodermatophilus normandii]|uniref:Uncharacterized protein n=1 Tax=Geodermatophilus normandii TaxID=1137989 RepID=A0A317QQ39_9ACTN|nr:hypothetical protein [Geodermatophilus normandii]PWW24921.1 hypothetical protein JD79_04113 [Geodermatophilus normandii]